MEKMNCGGGRGGGREDNGFIAGNSHLVSNYRNLSDVGSSSMMHRFNPMADHQYNVGPSVSNSWLYNGFNKMDDLSLAMEFQKLNVGNGHVSSDHRRLVTDSSSRVGLGDCNNAVRFRPSCVENFGIGASPLYKDEGMCRLLGERPSNFGDLGFQQRGNGLNGDRMSLYDRTVSRVNGHFGRGNVIPRGHEYCDSEVPAHFWSMYGAPVINDDTFQQNTMSFYGASNNGGRLSGVLQSKQALLNQRNVLYNEMLEQMRVSENPPLALLKKTRHPYAGIGHDKYSSSRRKPTFSSSFSQERNGVIGSPVGSCDSLILETMFGSLAEVQGNIFHLAKDQNGCRFLQRKCEEGSFEDIQIIFEEIIDHVFELMINPFGNYLIQKLLDVCNEDQRLKIVHMVTKDHGELVRICLNTHGTRVVQKLIDSLKTRSQISLMIRALEPVFLDLIQDLNGNHVVQRCLQCLDCDDNKFIYDAAAQFCVEIATHRHGCCVLQRCIAHSSGDHRKKLIDKVCSNGLILAQDPFGNYVVQYIIELKIPSAAAQLMSKFEGHYVHLSMQKFSSHVVEKCLKFIVESQARIVYELLSVPHFEQLLQDPYANYVVQSALEVTEGSVRKSLVTAVRPHATLRTNPYCKKIFTRGLINH